MKYLIVLVMFLCIYAIAETSIEDRLASIETRLTQLEQVQKCQLVVHSGGMGAGWCPVGYFVNDVRIQSMFNNNFTVWTSCQYYTLECK